MIVDIDDNSGFCFGVVRAITTAEDSIASGRKVWSLGDIVHNRVEVQRLESLGLSPLRRDEFERLSDARVLIRAHGEPPSVYEHAARHGIELIDATCPVVAQLQKHVRKAYAMMKEQGGRVVILGKKGHAEVVGLTGQVDEDATVIESVEDLDSLDFSKPLYLLSQTTQSLTLFGQIGELMKQRAADPSKVYIHDTICRRVANREPKLREFARAYDVVVFVSGRKSSNGRVLFQVCLESNPRSHMVEDETELDPQWFRDGDGQVGVMPDQLGGQREMRVGICGATSTPRWLMEKVARSCREL